MRTLLLAVVALVACNNSPLGNAPPDFAPAPDLGASPDLAPIVDGGLQSVDAAVGCGDNLTCVPPDGVCCRVSPFGAGTCIAPTVACGSSKWFCDSPNDCDPGQLCCDTGTGSTCMTEAQCSAQMGRRMCTVDGECKSGEMCCGQGPSPGFFCGLACPVSRRAFKEGIDYLDDAALARVHDQLLHYRLSTWRYKTDAPATPRHLGFIIDDVGLAPSVAADGEHVDLYGYASMAVATIQVQAREIDALKLRIDALERRLDRAARARKR